LAVLFLWNFPAEYAIFQKHLMKHILFFLVTSILMFSNSFARKPNVVVIMADDLGYGDIACNGALPESIETPNIDSIANIGINFTNAYCTSATCSPSRYSFLTGEYAFRRKGVGILSGDAKLIIDTEKTTLASMFQKAGYKTAAIGKWHLGIGKNKKVDWNQELDGTPQDIGFDYHFIFPATNDRMPCIYVEQNKVANLDLNDPIKLTYSQKEIPAPTEEELKSLRWESKAKRDQIYNGAWRFGYMTGGNSALWKDENIADDLVAKAKIFIEENKDTPFFIYFATNDIHSPHIPHARFAGKSNMGPRGDAILSFDWSVGEIINALKKAKVFDDTILIITSDNGPMVVDGGGVFDDGSDKLLGKHKPAGVLREGKYSIFEGGTRIPLIISYPKHIKKSATSEALVSQVDMFRSFANMLKIELEENVARDSFDTLSAFLGDTQIGRDWIVEYTEFGPKFAIRKGDIKYIPAAKDFPELLYDLSKDPSEKHNLLKESLEKAEELKLLLQEIMNQK